jgi:hypothetical protein
VLRPPTYGTVGPDGFALPEDGAAFVNKGVAQEHKIETDQVGRPRHKSNDRLDDRGNAVMGVTLWHRDDMGAGKRTGMARKRPEALRSALARTNYRTVYLWKVPATAHADGQETLEFSGTASLVSAAMRGASWRASLDALRSHGRTVGSKTPNGLNAVHSEIVSLFNDDSGFSPIDIGIFNGDFVIVDVEVLMQEANAEAG